MATSRSSTDPNEGVMPTSGRSNPSGAMPPPLAPSLSSGASRNRTPHACDRCRMMRTKCSAGSRCTKCIKDDAICVYGDRKRERNKKDLAESYDRIVQLERDNTDLLDALRNVLSSSGISGERHAGLVDLLTRMTDDNMEQTPTESFLSPTSSRSMSSAIERSEQSNPVMTRGGEAAAASSVGSPGMQGELHKIVDMDSGTGVSGFVGKMSDISWTQRVREYLLVPSMSGVHETSQIAIDPHDLAAKDFSYFMDDEDLLAIDEDHIDALVIPPLNIALLLTEAFFHSTQGAFRFLLREQFLHDFSQFPQLPTMLSWSKRRWLSLANLVWAIGAKWLHMCDLDRNGFWDNHLLHYARARALGLDHRVLFDHPDIERVQGIGLLALFLFINGSISRAYTTLGHALRHAVALGLHLKVTDPTITPPERDRRARTWFSLYSLEVLITEILGRPKSVSIADVTVELTTTEETEYTEVDLFVQSRKTWLEFLQSGTGMSQSSMQGFLPWHGHAKIDPSVSKLHFFHHMQLCEISDKLGMGLYRGLQNQAWSETQKRIEGLRIELEGWFEDLPEQLRIDKQLQAPIDDRARLELAMYHFSVQMMLHRPCLCDIRIPDQSPRSIEFNKTSAQACVQAAIAMIQVLPDTPAAALVNQSLPWWTLLHYISQATAVLLVELCLDCQHFDGLFGTIPACVNKAMSYLICLAGSSLSAYKAWRIYRGLIYEVNKRHIDLNLGISLTGQPIQPFGWVDQDEASLQQILPRSLARDVQAC